MTAESISALAARLYPFAYSITSADSGRAVEAFQQELPFRLHEWPSGIELNGWEIPPAWSVDEALIVKDGKIVWDGTSSPLGVVWLSPCFQGRVDLATLRRHLFYSEEEPQAVVYHWGGLYRPAERDWGFCLPKTLYDGLEEGSYDIRLSTRLDPSVTMKVLDFTLPGESRRTILINAHNCHPFQANDDISGCAVGIRLMQELAKVANRHFTYRLLIAPELVGTAFWLNSEQADADFIQAALLLKAVGNPGKLRMQESFTGTAQIDKAAHAALKGRFANYDFGPFRTVYGNDETVFEAPGYEIPTVSLTRMPFSTYHTDLDRPEALSEQALKETLEVALDICLSLEASRTLTANFKGLVSLSNPRYNLYKRAKAPGLDRQDDDPEARDRWNLLMNCLPRYLDGRTTVLDMAVRHGLPVGDVLDYVKLWVERGLASFAERDEHAR